MAGTISLSKPMLQFVTEQAAARGLKDGSAFVQQVLREEKKRQAVAELVKKLRHAEQSGFETWTADSLNESRQRLKARKLYCDGA